MCDMCARAHARACVRVCAFVCEQLCGSKHREEDEEEKGEGEEGKGGGGGGGLREGEAARRRGQVARSPPAAKARLSRVWQGVVKRRPKAPEVFSNLAVARACKLRP